MRLTNVEKLHEALRPAYNPAAHGVGPADSARLHRRGQPPRRERVVGEGAEGCIRDLAPCPFQREQVLVLLDDGVLGFR